MKQKQYTEKRMIRTGENDGGGHLRMRLWPLPLDRCLAHHYVGRTGVSRIPNILRIAR